MLIAPRPENDAQRLQAMEQALCTYVPREDRFDRITRTAMRLLDVPIALISIVAEDVQWFRSVQGLPDEQTSRDLSFCGHVIVDGKVLAVPDARTDPRFWDNPLVTGEPFIRAYLGVPLRLAPGVRAGTLCTLDTRPRGFNYRDIEALQDLARMAESELRLDAMASAQKRLLLKLDQLERRARLDAQTGCWNVRGFRELVAMAVQDAQRDGSSLALCHARVANFDALTAARSPAHVEGLRRMVAQVLRQRLPDGGALAWLGRADFCALVPGPTPLVVEELLAHFTYPKVELDVPGLRLDMTLDLQFGLAFLHEVDPAAAATEIWASALANLKA